jgi:plastocyanin
MSRLAALLLAGTAFTTLPVLAAEEPAIELTIENHKFTPERLEIPTGKKVKLVVDNKDATAEEFDSDDLRVEKVIGGNSKGTVWIGPLKAGEYKFVGEYHDKTAHGVVVAK